MSNANSGSIKSLVIEIVICSLPGAVVLASVYCGSACRECDHQTLGGLRVHARADSLVVGQRHPVHGYGKDVARRGILTIGGQAVDEHERFSRRGARME